MEAESEELKKASVKAFNEKLRSTILCKNPESDPEELSSIWKAASIQKTLAAKKADTTRSPPPPRAPPKQMVNDEALDEDIESFVNQVYQEASEALASTAAEALNQKDEVDEASTTKKDVKVQEDQNVGRSKNDDPAYHPQGIKPKKSPLKGRPAWALSEDQAEALDEEEEEVR